MKNVLENEILPEVTGLKAILINLMIMAFKQRMVKKLDFWIINKKNRSL